MFHCQPSSLPGAVADMQVQELEEAAADLQIAGCACCAPGQGQGQHHEDRQMLGCCTWSAAMPGGMNYRVGGKTKEKQKKNEGFVQFCRRTMPLSESDGCLAWHRVSGRRYCMSRVGV